MWQALREMGYAGSYWSKLTEPAPDGGGSKAHVFADLTNIQALGLDHLNDLQFKAKVEDSSGFKIAHVCCRFSSNNLSLCLFKLDHRRTAELNGYNLALNTVRYGAIVRRALELFPGMSRPELASCWAGLRPATPGNVPDIGSSGVTGLFFNTGGGTFGWTHGCLSGRALAELISCGQPEVDFACCGINQKRLAARSKPFAQQKA